MASRISERFCALDADMTVASDDGVLFHVHRKNLAVHSDVFADAENATRPENGDEIVYLSEHSVVLDLLFQFMYCRPQPDLEALEFKTLASLAEAAEKYVVYAAVALCRMRMKEFISAHPLEVLEYAVRHDHPHLANEAARRSMGCGVGEAIEVLPPDIFKTWILFHERWHKQIFQGLTDMLYYDSHIPLVRRCIAVPNPVCTFHQELDIASFSSKKFLNRMMDMKFMNEATEA
ncbi:hypothetical protein DFH08DRAFT_848348 [Mycena albidolilacea]|uniref:BTB domain-containing protein n=1 Tax=Mycena albidolilacea TaxID=1033008 RepID=A0AAD7AGZ0_9AGAR|nr:hypothetical protein DFH08DRAFT_848348 [Mycena albidolilacea]